MRMPNGDSLTSRPNTLVHTLPHPSCTTECTIKLCQRTNRCECLRETKMLVVISARKNVCVSHIHETNIETAISIRTKIFDIAGVRQPPGKSDGYC